MRVEVWLTNLSASMPDALGLGCRIVGVDTWSDYPPRVLRLPNVGSDLHVQVERVAALAPDLAVACWCGAQKLPTLQRILTRDGWADAPTMRGQCVAAFAEDALGRPGPRLADGLERLARLLHPKLTPESE